MSYLTYQVKCEECGEIYNTAFGIVGMRIIADPLRKCPKCGGTVEKCADEWKSAHAETQPHDD
jgi:rRNA maturation endonuclease Nob1